MNISNHFKTQMALFKATQEGLVVRMTEKENQLHIAIKKRDEGQIFKNQMNIIRAIAEGNKLRIFEKDNEYFIEWNNGHCKRTYELYNYDPVDCGIQYNTQNGHQPCCTARTDTGILYYFLWRHIGELID